MEAVIDTNFFVRQGQILGPDVFNLIPRQRRSYSLLIGTKTKSFWCYRFYT